MHIKPRGDQILEWRFPVLLVQMFPAFCILPMIDSWAALFALQGPRAVDRLSTDPTGFTGNLELGATNVCRNGLKSKTKKLLFRSDPYLCAAEFVSLTNFSRHNLLA